jgi:anti-anti-sigma factor
MKIFQEEKDGVVCLKISGRLDAESAPDAEQAVKGLLGEGKRRLLFDLSEMSYISSAGLRVVLIAVKQLQRTGGKIVLSALTPTVKEVFDVSNFSRIIPITETVEAGFRKL